MTLPHRMDLVPACGLALAGLLAPPAWTQVSFEPLFPLPTVELTLFPFEMELVDLDGDGFLDVVTVDYPSTVVVALGAGGGAFGPPDALAAAAYADDVAVGDLDADGALDLACACTSVDALFVFKGLGGGAFAPGVSWPAGDSANAARLADMDEDGDLDALTTAAGGVAFLAGDGSGGFLAPVLGVITQAVNRFEIGDLDLDGHLDLVAGAGGILVFDGDGQGTLAATASYPTALAPLDLELADLDGNGLLDIAAVHLDHTLTLLLATAPGLHAPAPAPGLAYCDTPYPSAFEVRAHDLDDDGDLDLAVASRACRNVQVFAGDGLGGFAAPVVHEVGASCNALAVGDVDADGDADIAVAAEFMGLALLVGDGASGLVSGEHIALPHQFSPTSDETYAIVAADLDADGTHDVLATHVEFEPVGPGGAVLPSLVVATGRPEGGLGPPTMTPAPDVFPEHLALGDLDGDGDADAVLADSSTDVLVALGGGDGSFLVQAPVVAGAQPTDVATADFDEDGLGDAAVSLRFDDAVKVLLGDGTGGWSSSTTLAAGDRPESLAAADLDADGHVDMATANHDSHTLSLLFGDGLGQFVATSPLATTFRPTDVEAADADDDGDLDLLVLHEQLFIPNSLGLLRGDGSGGFASVETLLTDDEALLSVEAADVHGDGVTDLLVTAHYSLTVLAGDGAGSFAPAGQFGCRGGTDLTLPDVDRDGALDVVTTGEGLSVLRNRTPTPWIPAPGGLAGAAGVPVLTGTGELVAGTPMALALTGALPASAVHLVVGVAVAELPFKGGVLVPTPDLVLSGLPTDAAGSFTLQTDWPAGAPSGLVLLFQSWVQDAGGPQGFAATNALAATVP